MSIITKSKGTTLTEQQLAHLADLSFLSLWSYPNVYRAPGKELCDVLVVCGNNVIVFSDKSIDWPKNVPIDVAWGRWYRRAIGHSAKQLQRAIRWITQHPDRIFLDAACKDRFPIEVPPITDLKIHGVIVARGASEACKNYFRQGSGSLAVSPHECSTTKSGQVPPYPFFVGNPSPDSEQVFHILDDVSLPVALLELDTITDLVRYLDRRAAFLLGGHLMGAEGEEDLIGLYSKDLGPDGDHDFVIKSRTALTPKQFIVIEGGTYDAFRRRPEYRRKKAADRISYAWDALIETFAKHIMSDTSYIVRGYEDYHSPAQRELGLRYMALAPRLERRSHALAIRGAFERIGDKDRFFRAMLPPEESLEETGFFILLVKRRGRMKDIPDEEYRAYRASLTQAYVMNLLRHRRDLKRVIGISTEGESERGLRSEDIVYAEQPDWTPEYEAGVLEAAELHEIMGMGRSAGLTYQLQSPKEYPPSHHRAMRGENPIPYDFMQRSQPGGNRAQRRAANAKRRRGRH